MKLLACLTALFAFFTLAVYANTEKVIFVAPPSTSYSRKTSSRLHEWSLGTLSPANLTLRASLPVIFPTNEQPYGRESWYLLKGLHEHQRYEVRVCWAAIQPTNFWLHVFQPSEILQNSELLNSLDDFSRHHQAQVKPRNPGTENILLLRVRAAADFFTTNRILMLDPPPVDVDIILDPYIANVFPSSLQATAVYIVTLAVGSWFLSGIIWSRLSAAKSAEKDHKD